MAVHIEAQNHEEIIQIRSRELQLENTKKLEQLTPIVESIGEIDLQSIEDNTNQIKTMVENNIDNQIDLDEIANMITTTTKGITELKKSVTRLSNSLKEASKKIEELNNKLGDDTND